MTPETVIKTYESVGAEWARQRNAQLIERGWLDRFLSLAPRRARQLDLLDLGCGAGRPIATYLSDRRARLTGVDAAATMVTLYQKVVPEAQVIQADMRGLDLGRKFDGILAWDSFFHLSPDDQKGMFPTFAQHAAPGAALMFTSGTGAGEVLGEVAGQPIYHASLDPEDYRRQLEENGFKVIRHVAEDPDCAGHTVWLARFTA